MEVIYALLTALFIASTTCGWVLWLYLMYEDHKTKDSNEFSVHQVETPQGQDQGVTTQEKAQMQSALDCYLTQPNKII